MVYLIIIGISVVLALIAVKINTKRATWMITSLPVVVCLSGFGFAYTVSEAWAAIGYIALALMGAAIGVLTPILIFIFKWFLKRK